LNGLTKAFVVLVTILSVVLVALIVPFVANTENHRQKVAEIETRLALANQKASLKQNEIEAVASQAAEEISKLKAEVTLLTSRITSLTSDLARAENEALTQRTRNAQTTSQLNVLTAASKQYADITAALQKELNERRSETVELQTRLIELSRRNNDLEEQGNTLNRTVRHAQEQMTTLEEEVRKYNEMIQRLPADVRRQLAAGTQEQTASGNQPFVPSMSIRGTVTAVEKRLDDTFVQVNVGSRDGVEANMKFWVHRGEQFIGTLVITRVDAGVAAGRMQLLQGQVAQGDQILTGGTGL